MKFKPLHNYIVIKVLSDEEIIKLEEGDKKDFGIILNKEIEDKKGKILYGVIYDTGPGKLENGNRLPLSVVKGQLVAFSEYDSYEMIIQNQTYYIMRDEFVFTILE